MEYRWYPYSCGRIRRGIKKKYPGAGELRASTTELRNIVRQIKRITNNTDAEALEGVLANHLLWMIDHLQTYHERNAHFTAKRARWMGWVYAYCEWLGIFSQQQVHIMARRDSHAGQV